MPPVLLEKVLLLTVAVAPLWLKIPPPPEQFPKLSRVLSLPENVLPETVSDPVLLMGVMELPEKVLLATVITLALLLITLAPKYVSSVKVLLLMFSVELGKLEIAIALSNRVQLFRFSVPSFHMPPAG